MADSTAQQPPGGRSPTTELRVAALSLNVGQRLLLDSISFALGSGELVAVLGPNGAGKSTLLRATLGLARPTAGTAWLDGLDTSRMTTGERATRVAYLPQARSLAWPLRVWDVVALGRFAYGVSSGRQSSADRDAIARALRDCGIEALAERRVDTLSGGELARMHCARTFASAAPLIVADEPTAALDPEHQLSILDLLRANANAGRGVLVVLHDLNLAARYADRLLWLQQGRLVADGPPGETLTEERLAAVFNIEAQVDGTRIHYHRALRR